MFTRLPSNHSAYVSLGALLALFAAGCSFDASGIPAGGFLITCQADVMECPVTALPVDVDSSSPGGYPTVASYVKTLHLWGMKAGWYPVYYQWGGFLSDGGCGLLQGSLMVMTGLNDWSIDGEDFLRVTLLTDAEAIYVAYDSRALSPPTWLTDPSRFAQMTDPKHTSQACQLRIMLEGASVNMNLWTALNVSNQGDSLTLPGNNHDHPDWSSITAGHPAMYLVFVKPRIGTNCGQPTFQVKDSYTACYEYRPDQENQARQAAVAAATANMQARWGPMRVVANAQVVSSVYLAACSLTVRGSMLSVPSVAFQQNSEVEFLPAEVTADIVMPGTQVSRPVGGVLDFEYVVDGDRRMPRMTINRMYLEVADINSEIGAFTEIRIGAVSPCTASGVDNPMPVGFPCERYRIATGELIATGGCRLDGTAIAFTSENAGPLDITLDATRKTFEVTGLTLHATVPVGEPPSDIDITLPSLRGHVLNYAPHAAAGVEGNPFAECNEHGNQTPIYLNAGSSFDVDGTLPESAFSWYEDYKLVTQHLWGTGRVVSIGSHQMGYGVHHITLVVQDSFGVAATDAVDVEVRDTTGPSLTAPADVVLMLSAAEAGPSRVDLGTASGNDDCDSQVRITNDAPADGVFQLGQTDVTWRAEDGRGNQTTRIQRVILIPLDESPDWRSRIRDGTAQLANTADNAQVALRDCGDRIRCLVDLEPLVRSMTQSIDLLSGLNDLSGAEGLRGQVVERLSASRTLVEEARSLMAAGEMGASVAAGERLIEAAGLLDEATNLLGSQSRPPSGPQCFIATAAYGSPTDPQVVALRGFRDRWLMTNAPGRFFVRCYCTVSPPIAEVVGQHEWLRWLVRVVLWPVTGFVIHPLVGIAIAAGGIAMIRRMRRRRRWASTA